jgi:hypothetical protein
MPPNRDVRLVPTAGRFNKRADVEQPVPAVAGSKATSTTANIDSSTHPALSTVRGWGSPMVTCRQDQP